MLRHNIHPAHFAAPLHVQHGGQNLIVRDHAATNDQDFVDHPAIASFTASSNASRLSVIASSLITSGGQIFTVPPPSPTGLNINTPFSIVRRTISNASVASGSFVPGFTIATP